MNDTTGALRCTSAVRELGWRQAARWYTIASRIDKGGGIGCVKYIQRTWLDKEVTL
jgi:hypothetical protein